MKLNAIANGTFWLMFGWLVVAMPAHAFYDPSLGRWLNRDPIGELGGLNLHGYLANNPLDRYDPFGEADLPKDNPPVTSPPIFGEKPFRPGRDNCLCYGLDRPGRPLQPDGGVGARNGKNCKDLVGQIKKNYDAQDVPKDGKCPTGTHKIAVFSDGDGGYHIQRQDSDGGWSEMSLGGGPERELPYPPRKCKRGGPGKTVETYAHQTNQNRLQHSFGYSGGISDGGL